MYFLLFLVLATIVYIESFKDNFTKENIEKVTPIIASTTGLILIFCIVYSIL